MKRLKKYSLFVSPFFFSSAFILPAYAADNLVDAYREGKAYININTRYEYVDEDNGKDQADAMTARFRVGYDTGKLMGFSGKLEFSHNTDIFGLDDFNSTQNGKAQYSVVADPRETEVNQAYLDYSGVDGLLVRYGRQRIILDKARFVGNVGWRQNEQTYDAFKLAYSGIAGTKLTYAYIDKVQNFLGKTINHDTHLLNASYTGFKPLAITGYYYGLQNEDNQNQSSDTFGLQLSGKTAINSGLSVHYLAEYANQVDAHKNSHDFDLDYYHLNAGVGFSPAVIKLGYEVLEGNGKDAFQTPLATKHAWNGWADKFLGVPTNGLEDLYLSVGAKAAGMKFKAVYHDFQSNKGSIDYGSEIDLVLVKPINKNFKVLIKYADYNADQFSVDTKKLWIGFNAKFSQ